jgi:hypothetical protein
MRAKNPGVTVHVAEWQLQPGGTWLALATPRNAAFVARLKKALPKGTRWWFRPAGLWMIIAAHGADALDIARECYGAEHLCPACLAGKPCPAWSGRAVYANLVGGGHLAPGHAQGGDAPSRLSLEQWLSWRRLVRVEPRLEQLRQEAAAVQYDSLTKPYFCANEVWYGYGPHEPREGEPRGFKGRLTRLVGFKATPTADPVLRTMVAYDLAYDVVYHELPDCRDCNEGG